MQEGSWTFLNQSFNEFYVLPWEGFHTAYLCSNKYCQTIIKKDFSSLNIIGVRWGMMRDTWTELCFLMSAFFTPVESERAQRESPGNRESSHGARSSAKVWKGYGLAWSAWIKGHRPLLFSEPLVTGSNYRRMLRYYALLKIQELLISSIFKQDGAPAHYVTSWDSI